MSDTNCGDPRDLDAIPDSVMRGFEQAQRGEIEPYSAPRDGETPAEPLTGSVLALTIGALQRGAVPDARYRARLAATLLDLRSRFETLEWENADLLAALKEFSIEPPENAGEEWTVCVSEDGPEPGGDTAREAARVVMASFTAFSDKAMKLDEEHAALRSQVARVEGAVRWALGEEGEFPLWDDGGDPTRRPADGKRPIIGYFWWRTELRTRAFGSASGEGEPR